MSPKGACGDVVRNVTGCPLAGIHAHELLNASPLALEGSAYADGESGVLQPSAEVQDYDYWVSGVVLLPGDQ